MIIDIITLLIVLGVLYLIVTRTKIGKLVSKKTLHFNRQDIIQPTNWIRSNKIEFRKHLGIGLIVSGAILLIFELIWGPFYLLPIWLIFIVIGVTYIILAWWIPYLIIHDYTHKVFIKVPDVFSLHTFHTNLRQCAEDIGYGIQTDVSPGENSYLSSYKNNIFLLNGGFKAIKKPLLNSKPLLSSTSESSFISDILTMSTLGIFLIMLGGTLITYGMTVWIYKDWGIVVSIIGKIMLLFGIIVFVHDYITRTQKKGEIYVIEEGTVYIPTAKIYDSKLIEKSELLNSSIIKLPDSNISTSQTSCELTVTLGARCTKLFNKNELEDDFKVIIDSIEKIADENKLNVIDVQYK
ncbi:MAG: hypothetical protein HF967_00655 [Methanosarcinales archaeon]|nr:hypothetical protein [Methanosarcinales archaeon]